MCQCYNCSQRNKRSNFQSADVSFKPRRSHYIIQHNIVDQGCLLPSVDGQSRVCGGTGGGKRSAGRLLRVHREERHNRT